MELIAVYKAENEMSAELTKGFLESNGVKAVTLSSNEYYAAYSARYNPNTPNRPWEVFVNMKDKEKAFELLKERDDGKYYEK